jgi:hypothetical protein
MVPQPRIAILVEIGLKDFDRTRRCPVRGTLDIRQYLPLAYSGVPLLGNHIIRLGIRGQAILLLETRVLTSSLSAASRPNLNSDTSATQ